jgi:DNA-binding ferritin-like protein
VPAPERSSQIEQLRILTTTHAIKKRTSLRSTHELCERHNDVATSSLIENSIDETERRTWFLSEIVTER